MGLAKDLILGKRGKGHTPKPVIDSFIGALRQKKQLKVKLAKGKITKKRVLWHLRREHSKWVNLVQNTKQWKLIKPRIQYVIHEKEGAVIHHPKPKLTKITIKLHGRRRTFRIYSNKIKGSRVRIRIKRKDGLYQHYWYKVIE